MEEEGSQNGKVLNGVIAYCEVRNEHMDISSEIGAEMEVLGAVARDRLTSDVTHVVFRQGTKRTWITAHLRGINVVSVAWIKFCQEYNFIAPITMFRVPEPTKENRVRCRFLQPPNLSPTPTGRRSLTPGKYLKKGKTPRRSLYPPKSDLDQSEDSLSMNPSDDSGEVPKTPVNSLVDCCQVQPLTTPPSMRAFRQRQSAGKRGWPSLDSDSENSESPSTFTKLIRPSLASPHCIGSPLFSPSFRRSLAPLQPSPLSSPLNNPPRNSYMDASVPIKDPITKKNTTPIKRLCVSPIIQQSPPQKKCKFDFSSPHSPQSEVTNKPTIIRRRQSRKSLGISRHHSMATRSRR